MSELDTGEVLCSILEMVRDLHVYSRRQHGWIIALAETIEKDDELRSALERHPLYDQGSAPSLRSIDVMIRNVDALIQKLRDQG